MRIKIILLSLILFSAVLASCTPYRMDIRQGNFVTADMRERLKLGMTRQQVRYVLGTPLLNDAFHGNRWDYIYTFQHNGKVVDRQHLVVYFEGDKLVRIDDNAKVEEAAPAVVAPEIHPAPETNPAPAIIAPEPDVVPEAAAPVAASSVAAPAIIEVPQPPPAAKADPSTEVLHTLQDWAAAWSAQDVQKYLAFYAPAFDTGGMSREDWDKQRAIRVSKPKAIRVELSDLAVSVQDSSHATAKFTQSYRSDRYHDVTRKILQMEKTGGSWLIVSEQTVK